MVLFTKASKPSNRSRRNQEGYVMLTIMFTVSLMTIAATAILLPIAYQMKRDQEVEMIHRGVQYSRAIRAYYKKYSRYPTKLEDLDNTNNFRYLRHHYKDPLTGKDFKLLHYGEPGVQLGLGSIGGGSIPGATPVGAPSGSNGSGSAFGGSSSFGGSSAFGGGSSSGGSSSGVNSNGVFAQSSSGFGGSSSGGFGSNSNSQNGSSQQGNNSTSGSSTPASDSTQDPSQASGSGSDSSSGSQLVSGGAIVGVASTSKKTGLHEFNHKKKFNEWQFVYDPSTDRGGLITTPYQPALQNLAGGQNLNSQPGSSTGTNGTSSGSSFGNSFGNSSGSSFGNSSGSSFGQSPGGNNSNSFGSQPSQPPSSSPQQQ